jgi:phage minor structural protein
MIRVYDATEKIFDNNGIKTIHPLFAEVTKTDNSDYYVELEDILDNLEYYQKGMIVRVPTPWGIQGFRCDNPIIQNDRISCKAWHLSYDSENYIINSATATDKNCNDAINHYNDNTDITSPFTVISDISLLKTTVMERKSLFDAFTELISTENYGGHWYRDNFTFGILSSIGEDRGVVLAYNKNITDIIVEENWDNVCTKLLPYATVKLEDEEEDTTIILNTPFVELTEQIYDIPFTKTLKFEHNLNKDDYSTEADYISAIKGWLYREAVKYLNANKLPQINYSVSAKLDNVSDVGDIIYVKHPKCKVDIATNVMSVKYDAIRGRYTAIEFGNFKKEIKNLTQEIASLAKAESDKKIEDTSALLQAQLASATARINSVLSSSFVINNGNEILVVDRLPKEEAVYCLKINSAGIGFSNTGIYGTFTSAWTIDGTLNMQAVNVINLTASLIKGGTLKLGGTNNSSGTFELYDNSNKLMALMDKEGLTVYAQNGDFVKLNAEVGFAGYNKDGTKIYWADGDVFRMKNAEVENEIKIAGKIKIVPVSTSDNVGVGFIAIN